MHFEACDDSDMFRPDTQQTANGTMPTPCTVGLLPVVFIIIYDVMTNFE